MEAITRGSFELFHILKKATRTIFRNTLKGCQGIRTLAISERKAFADDFFRDKDPGVPSSPLYVENTRKGLEFMDVAI